MHHGVVLIPEWPVLFSGGVSFLMLMFNLRKRGRKRTTTNSNNFHPILIPEMVFDSVLAQSRAHLSGTISQIIEIGPSSFGSFSIGLAYTLCVIKGIIPMALLNMCRKMKLGNEKVNNSCTKIDCPC